jgi:hypothetical protein
VYAAIIIALVVFVIILAMRKQPKAAFVLLVGAMFFSWISRAALTDEDTTFQASPVGLRVTIEHAKATILQMQSMLGLLGEAVVDIDRYSGALDGVPETVKRRHRERVNGILADLKGGQDAVSEVRQAEHGADASIRASAVYQAALDALPTSGAHDQHDFNTAYNDAWTNNDSPYDVITPEALSALFSDFAIHDLTAKRALNEYTSFYNDAQRIDD